MTMKNETGSTMNASKLNRKMFSSNFKTKYNSLPNFSEPKNVQDKNSNQKKQRRHQTREITRQLSIERRRSHGIYPKKITSILCQWQHFCGIQLIRECVCVGNSKIAKTSELTKYVCCVCVCVYAIISGNVASEKRFFPSF